MLQETHSEQRGRLGLAKPKRDGNLPLLHDKHPGANPLLGCLCEAERGAWPSSLVLDAKECVAVQSQGGGFPWLV